MAVISITYSGGIEKPIKYKAITINLSVGKKKNHTFKSNDFVKDWYDAMKFIITGDIAPLAMSSSVNDFIMDGAKFDSAYLHIVDGSPLLKYIDRTMENWYLTDIDDGIEFFVEEGTTPTWEELKKICKDEKTRTITPISI